MSKLISRFFRNESGATAIEYGLIAAGIAVVIVGGIVSATLFTLLLLPMLFPLFTRESDS